MLYKSTTNYFFQRPSCHNIFFFFFFFFFFHLVIELTETGIHQPTLNSQTIIKDFISRPLSYCQILHHLRITAALINEFFFPSPGGDCTSNPENPGHFVHHSWTPQKEYSA
jgi:hypothetical protein